MRLLFALILALASTLASAGPGREALDKFLGELTTLEARFEQAVLDTENARQGLFHGIFHLKRPGRFRWDYLEPEKRLIIADGDNLWLIESDLEQITRFGQDFALRNTPAPLFLSSDPIDESFQVIELGERRGMQWLELLPREADSDLVRILLAFNGDSLRQLELVDTFGQVTRFSFFEIRKNPPVEDELFTFDAPSNWDIITENN